MSLRLDHFHANRNMREGGAVCVHYCYTDGPNHNIVLGSYYIHPDAAVAEAPLLPDPVVPAGIGIVRGCAI
jgi:hypothetical protein